MGPLHILIVEDETITAMDLRETLEEAGHKVTGVARDLQTAVKLVRSNPPDLALVDIQLEGSTGDGIATAKELLTYHRMPIIYLTANSEQETFQAAKETLPAAYLLKPFRHDELKLQVELAYHHFQYNLPTATNTFVPKYVFLPVDKGYEKIAVDQVIYLKADGAYAKVYTVKDETPYHVSTNLSHLAQYFPLPNFYRLSRSLLINLDHLDRLERNYLFMNDNKTVIQIPSASRKDLLSKLTVVRTK